MLKTQKTQPMRQSSTQRLWSRSAIYKLIALSLGMSVLTNTIAQEDQTTKQSAQTLKKITVTAPALSDADSVYSKARSSVYLSKEDLDRYAPISVGDIFKGVAGVGVGDSRNGGALDVQIRGLQGQSRVAIKVDGAQQALDAYRGYAGTHQRSYVDQALIGSVTINKGPSAKAGHNAVGGTVSMRTLEANDILRPDKHIGVRLTGEVWDNGIRQHYRPDQVKSDAELKAMPRTEKGGLFGSNAKSGSIAFATKNDKWDLVAAYSKRIQGNYFAGKHGFDGYKADDSPMVDFYKPGEEILNSSAQTTSSLLKATLRPSTEHTFSISYLNYDGENGEIMASDIKRSNTAGNTQYPLSRMHVNTLTADYAYKPVNNHLVNLKAKLWMTEAKSDQLTGWRIHAEGDSLVNTSTNDRYWSRNKNRRIGGDLNNQSTFKTNAGIFDLMVGAAFQLEDIEPKNKTAYTLNDYYSNRVSRDAKRMEYDFSTQLDYKPNERLTLWAGARHTTFKSRDRNRNATIIKESKTVREIIYLAPDEGKTYTAYWLKDEAGEFSDKTDPRVQNHLFFTDTNEQFTGAHYEDLIKKPNVKPLWEDYWEKEYTYDVAIGADFAEPLTESGSEFSPSLGIKYEFMPETFVFASYTEGVRLPSMFESTYGTEQVTPSQGMLKPERTKSTEIGISTMQNVLLTSQDSVSAKFVWFNNNTKNYITRNFNPINKLRGIMNFSNTDSYEVSGLEIQSQYDNGTFFMDFSATHYLKARTCDAAFAQSLRDSASSYFDTANTPNCTAGGFLSSYTNTQNPPRLSTNLTVGTRLLQNKLTLGGRMVYTSGPTDRLDKPWQSDHTTSQEVYRATKLFDLFATYQIHPQTSINVSIQNLTNRYYLDPLAQSLMPAPGRTVRVGLKALF